MQNIEFASSVNDDDDDGSKDLDDYPERYLPVALGSLKIAEEAAVASIGSSIHPRPSYPPPPPPRGTKAAATLPPAHAPPPQFQPKAARWDEDSARRVPHFIKELEGDPFMENGCNAEPPWQEMRDAAQDWPRADSAGNAVAPSAGRKRRNKIPMEHSESDVSNECEPFSFVPNPPPDGEALTTQLSLDVGNVLDGQWWDMCGLVGTVQGHVFRLAHHETSDVYDISIDPKHLKVSMCLLGENMDIELA